MQIRRIRRIALKTVDGLSPLPMSSAWVRDGLFVIGMDSEFAVYSQWRDDNISHDDTDIIDHRNLADSDLMSIAQESSMRSLLGGENQAAKSSLADLKKRKKGCTLFPTVIVSTCVPSSFEAQSSITVCLGATALGEFPIALMYFFTPSNVDKLGTDIKPVRITKVRTAKMNFPKHNPCHAF